MKIIFLLLILLSSEISFSEILLAVAEEGRFERGMDQNLNPQNYLNFSVEYFAQALSFGIEYFQGQPETTGQQSLSLSRQRQGAWLTSSWQSESWGFVAPYVRVGLGAYQDTVVTTLLGTSSQSTSRAYTTGFGGGGLRLTSLQTIFLALEARVIFGENQDPQPSFSGLLRLGLEF